MNSENENFREGGIFFKMGEKNILFRQGNGTQYFRIFVQKKTLRFTQGLFGVVSMESDNWLQRILHKLPSWPYFKSG